MTRKITAIALSTLALAILAFVAHPTAGQAPAGGGDDPPYASAFGDPGLSADPRPSRAEMLKRIEDLRSTARTKALEYANAVVQSRDDVSKNSELAAAAMELANLQQQIASLVAEGSHPGLEYGVTGGYGGYGAGTMGRRRGRMGGGGYGGEDMMGGYAEGPEAPDDPFLLQTDVLVQQLRATDSKDREQTLTQALRKVLNDLYEHRMRQREEQLRRFEERLAQLRTQLKRQRDAKDEVVDIRLKTLVNQAKGIGF